MNTAIEGFSPPCLECADEEVSINLCGLDREPISCNGTVACIGFCIHALANGLLALGSQCTITPGNTVLGWYKHDELRDD